MRNFRGRDDGRGAVKRWPPIFALGAIHKGVIDDSETVSPAAPTRWVFAFQILLCRWLTREKRVHFLGERGITL